jgi:ribosomal-protein-alanine N-acetyltransferase
VPPLGMRLSTARLLLRPPRPADVPELRRVMRRNAEHLRPWVTAPGTGEDPTSLTEVAKSVLGLRRAWRLGTAYTFLVWTPLGEATAAIVGRIGLTQVTRGPLESAYLGYWIDAQHQGRGLTTEAVEAVLAFAFGPAALHRVGAGVMPRNAASIRVLEKIGMRREGLAERLLKVAGVWEDHLQFALTSDEWHARKNAT